MKTITQLETENEMLREQLDVVYYACVKATDAIRALQTARLDVDIARLYLAEAASECTARRVTERDGELLKVDNG